ncbi:MAG: SurA N-terminal domain-containing protein [Actinomycetes bacterium]
MIRTAPRLPVRLLAAGLALTAGLAVTGCEPVKAGSAAVVGDERITTSDLQSTVAAVTEAQEGRGGNEGTLQQGALTRMIVGVIVDEAVARNHVRVTPGEVDERLSQLTQQAGGRAQLESSLVGQGVGPQELPGLVEQTLALEKLGTRLVPGAGPQAQAAQQQAVGRTLTRLSRNLGVTVNPRYGRWDARRAQLVPQVNDLSRPAKGSGGATPGGGGVPAPPPGG